MAGHPEATTLYSRVQTSNVETLLDRRRAGLRDAAAGRRRRSCSRTCRTATRSCSRASATRTTSGRTSRRRARTCSNTFLASGKVDDSLYVAQKVDFTPEVTQTALGKGLAGTMVGLAVLTVALAAADGPPGVQAQALRAQGERDAALGLRGRARPGRLVPRRADRDARLPGRRAERRAAGHAVDRHPDRARHLPGLGARDWRSGKAVGLVAAAGGALAGAWLGFHAATDLLALVTSIAGAVAGANLALILLDVSRGRSTGSGAVTGTAMELRRPPPEPAGAQARSAATSRS